MIENLHQRIIEASGLDIDRKWLPWVKRIDSIDSTKKGGYMFIGEFIQDRTIEYEPKAGLVLACARQGSRKKNNNYYQLVLLHPSGDIELTGNEWSDEDRGWAFLIKPEVEEQLLTISSHHTHSDIPSEGKLLMEPSSIKSMLESGAYEVVRFSPSDVPASFYWQNGAVFLRLLEVSDGTS